MTTQNLKCEFKQYLSECQSLILYYLTLKGAWFNFRRRTDLKWQGAEGFLAFYKSSKECRKLVKEALNS